MVVLMVIAIMGFVIGYIAGAHWLYEKLHDYVIVKYGDFPSKVVRVIYWMLILIVGYFLLQWLI